MKNKIPVALMFMTLTVHLPAATVVGDGANIGYVNTMGGGVYYSATIGQSNVLDPGMYSLDHSAAVGAFNELGHGSGLIALGVENKLDYEVGSIALGTGNEAYFGPLLPPILTYGYSNIMIGVDNKVGKTLGLASVDSNILIGEANEAWGNFAWVFGEGNIGQERTVTLGTYALQVPDAALIVGSGTGSGGTPRKNSLVVMKDGSVSVPSGGLRLSNGGLYFGANVNATLSAGAGGKAIFDAGVDISSGQLSIASTTASTNSTSGALVVSGGIGVAKDSYVNGLKVGRGLGGDETNTAFGMDAINSNTSGWANAGFGRGALYGTTTGYTNTALGTYVLYYATTASENTAAGAYSMHWTTTGGANSAFGKSSLQNTRTGTSNSAFGSYALFLSTAGGFNTAAGANALYNNLGSSNTAVGYNAQYSGTSGQSNVSLGSDSLYSNTSGSQNVALGTGAGRYQSDGTTVLTDPEKSIYIGSAAKGSTNADSYSIVIGAEAVGAGANTTVIGSSSTTHTYLKGKNMSPSLEVEGLAEFKGQVIISEPQGDISMGIYE